MRCGGALLIVHACSRYMPAAAEAIAPFAFCILALSPRQAVAHTVRCAEYFSATASSALIYMFASALPLQRRPDIGNGVGLLVLWGVYAILDDWIYQGHAGKLPTSKVGSGLRWAWKASEHLLLY